LNCPQCGGSYPIADGIINFLPRRTPNIGLGQFSNQVPPTAYLYERLWRPKALSILGGREWLPAEEQATIVRMLDSRQGNWRRELPTHDEVAYFLDQGCSTGFYARAIVRAFQNRQLKLTGTDAGHVVALDNSWLMVQEARGYIEREGLTGYISLVRADAENMPFIEGAFAGVANGGSLNEFKQTAPALREARRTLDKQGNAAFMVQMGAKKGFGKFINRAITLSSGIKFFELDRLNAYFRQTGFKVLEQQYEGLISITHLIPAEI
jgi:ubiquinone/menaquinone biosynthesis C-methylase UbiE